MNVRRALTVFGAGLTTGLLVTVLIIGLLDFEFSAIIGLPIGILTGLTALGTVAVTYDRLDVIERRAMSAYAAFGLAIIVITGLDYVNLARGLFSGTVAAGVGLTATALTYLGLWGLER